MGVFQGRLFMCVCCRLGKLSGRGPAAAALISLLFTNKLMSQQRILYLYSEGFEVFKENCLTLVRPVYVDMLSVRIS